MKEIVNWYCGELERNKLIKLFRTLNINIPGFTKKIDKAPLHLMKKKFTDIFNENTPPDKLMFYLYLINKELHDEIMDLSLPEIRERKKELVDKHGLPDYVLGLAVKAEPGELKNIKKEIKELMQHNEKQKEPNNKDQEQIKDLTFEIQKEIEKENKSIRKKLQDKNHQLDKLLNEIGKLKKNITNIEEKYKKQLSDLGKACERKNTEVEQIKEEFKEVKTQKMMLEKKLEEVTAENAQIIKENVDLKRKLNEYETKLKIWQAKYPGEKFDNKTLRFVYLGDKPNHVIKIISGVVVDKTIVDFNEAEQLCNGDESIEQYDAVFLLSSRCTSDEQRRKILMGLKRFKIKVHEIPNIKSSESIINRLITSVLGGKESVI